MAKRQALKRLWRLREMEEEQSRLELEARVVDRNRVAERLATVVEEAVQSRKSFAARLGDPDTVARTAALMELEQARRLQTAIRPHLEQAESEVELRREEFLARRTGRRQVETLLDREEEKAREATARRAQQMLDDWYGRRKPETPPSTAEHDRNREAREADGSRQNPSMNSV